MAKKERIDINRACEILECSKTTFYEIVKEHKLKKDAFAKYDLASIEAIAKSRKAITKPLQAPVIKDDKTQLIAHISSELQKLTPHAELDNLIVERYANALLLDKQIQAELAAGFTSYTPQGAEMPRAIFSIKRDNDKLLNTLEKVLGIGQANRSKELKDEKKDEMDELINV